MPSAVSPNPRARSAQPDELDRLLDFDNAVEDFMNDMPMRDSRQEEVNAAEQPQRDEDQEVQVKKKRQPVPKLDENRLLSNAGIPRLRKITKSRLRFRGKGHEFTDVTHLLNTYQLWLDDLYPRAKFKDALTMVEKVGHSKRMQVMRRAWLDDTKPTRRELTPPPDLEVAGVNDNDHETMSLQAQSSLSAPRQDRSSDDDQGALLAGQEQSNDRRSLQRAPREAEEPDEDELDALLAGEELSVAANTSNKPTYKGPSQKEPGEDELDALLAGEGSRREQSGALQVHAKRYTDDFADDEEAMAEMWN